MVEDQHFDEPGQAAVVPISRNLSRRFQFRSHPKRHGGRLGFWTFPWHTLNVLRFFLHGQYNVVQRFEGRSLRL